MNTLQRPPISIVGFVSGLVTGLALSVAVALYVTNSPVPFVNKVQRSTENVTPEAADPNRPLFSPQIPGPGATPDTALPTPAPAPAGSKSQGGPRPAGEPLVPPPPPVAAPLPPAPGQAAGAGDAAGAAGGRFMLQVGAYRSADDADAVRAHLALLGLDAKVSVGQSDGAPLYRVRLGPFGQLDDVNGIRRTLSENGMEPQVVHLP